MRNILQYPITPEEEIEVLSRLRDDILAEDLVGDMRPVVLNNVIKRLQAENEARQKVDPLARQREIVQASVDHTGDDPNPYK